MYANDSLFDLVKSQIIDLKPIFININLADGSEKRLETLIITIDVELNKRIIPTTFLYSPSAKVKQTLLGIDFIVSAKMVLDFSKSLWKFSDDKKSFKLMYESEIHLSEIDIPSSLSLRNNEGTQLSSDEKKCVNSLINQNVEIFETKSEPTPYAEHCINFINENQAPIFVQPFSLNSHKTEILKSEITKMLNKNIIEECESPWAAPVVLVPKPNNTYRVCIDYRKLNLVTVSDKYPMPKIDELLHLAKKPLYISTIDLESGYWQVPMKKQDQDKTSFITPFGLYRFKRMPFGLKNAPSTFQRLVNRFRIGIPNVLILAYLDDLIIISETFESHLKDIKLVFDRLK